MARAVGGASALVVVATVTHKKGQSYDIVKAIKQMAETRVLVGVPAAEVFRKPEPGEPATPINNAALAYIHEHGAPEANIPARPFMRPGVENARSEIIDRMRKIAQMASRGRPAEAMQQAFHALGLRVVASMKNKINEGVPPPLKPATIARRLARGRTGTVPLIDTGQLRNSLSYVVRKVTAK